MPQTSFAERLENIERSQGRPVTDRILVGLPEEQEALRTGGASAGAGSRAGMPVRFVAGFALMFGTFYLMAQMSLVDAWVLGMDALAPHVELVRMAVMGLVVVVMLFFAFKLQRAAFRVMSEPSRLPFAIGMVAGLALGAGPSEFADTMMAQLNLQ